MRVAELALSLDAQNDLKEIADSIALDNLQVSLEWADEINYLFLHFTLHPYMSPVRKEFHESFRCHPFGNYLIFYRASRKKVVIMRVIHAHRNIRKILRIIHPSLSSAQHV